MIDDEQYNISWRDKALCQNTETEDFFPYSINKKNFDKVRQLIRTCHKCPVEAQCLLEAVTLEHDGIWGGTTPKERAAWVRMLKKDGIKNITLEICEDFLQVCSNPKTNDELEG